MKKMKKFAALLLAVSMAAGMVACGSSDKKEETTKKEETKKDDKETKKLEGTLKVVTTGDAYQPLFDKFTEEVRTEGRIYFHVFWRSIVKAQSRRWNTGS